MSRNRIYVWALSAVAVCSLGVVVSAETWTDQKCQPTTLPVTTCGCPVGTDIADYCEGALPKADNCMYGEVTCWPSWGDSCEYLQIAFHDENQRCVNHAENGFDDGNFDQLSRSQAEPGTES